MTAVQLIKEAILLAAVRMGDIEDMEPITAENVDDIYEREDDKFGLQDARNEIRTSGEDTGLVCSYSRHYESDAVAMEMSDGRWVGWTYFYGGGKHGEPGEMDWMDDAYFLDCVEHQEMVTIKTFTKRSN